MTSCWLRVWAVATIVLWGIGSQVAAQSGQYRQGKPIQFSEPSDRSITTNLNLQEKEAKPSRSIREFDQDLRKGLDIFETNPSFDRIGKPTPTRGPSPMDAESRKARKEREKRENWIFLDASDYVPSEISAEAALGLNEEQQLTDEEKLKRSPLGRFLERFENQQRGLENDEGSEGESMAEDGTSQEFSFEPMLEVGKNTDARSDEGSVFQYFSNQEESDYSRKRTSEDPVLSLDPFRKQRVGIDVSDDSRNRLRSEASEARMREFRQLLAPQQSSSVFSLPGGGSAPPSSASSGAFGSVFSKDLGVPPLETGGFSSPALTSPAFSAPKTQTPTLRPQPARDPFGIPALQPQPGPAVSGFAPSQSFLPPPSLPEPSRGSSFSREALIPPKRVF